MPRPDDTLPPGPTICVHCRKALRRGAVYIGGEVGGPLHPECATAIEKRRRRARDTNGMSPLARWLLSWFTRG
jgi:hypothetical protein